MIWKNLRKKVAFFAFFSLLIWPPIHAIASKHFGFSSWRFFGWGMYASPYPDSVSNLSFIVICNPVSNEKELYQRVYKEFRSEWADASQSHCFDIFVKKGNSPLTEISSNHFCNDSSVEESLSFVKHFLSRQHLTRLANLINVKGCEEASVNVLAILTQQRIDMTHSYAFLENHLLSIKPQKIIDLGIFN
jgi:hypothetical protein